MDVIDSLILGLVQGLSEYLPISSSGHLEICQDLLGLNMTGADSMQYASGWCARSCFFSFVSVLPDGACMGLVAFGDLAPDNFFCSIIS